MNDWLTIGAITLAVAIAGPGRSHATTVYIPEGSAGSVLIVDATKDTVIGRIPDLPDIHGLGGAAGVPYLVAGSFAESAADQPPAIPKPAGVSESEHAAHHGGAKPPATPTANSISIMTILDAEKREPIRRLEVPGAVHHVAVSPDGHYAVATHPNADGVSIVDLSDFTVRHFIHTGPTPNYAVFSPDSRKVYVSNSGNGTVSEIESGKAFVSRNLPAGDMPEHLVISQDGKVLYVADAEAGAVTAIDLDRDETIKSFVVGGEIHGLDLSDDGMTLFVSNTGADKLAAIDMKSGEVRSVPLAPAPYHLTSIRGTGKLYISSRQEPKVWVVDQKSLQSDKVIPIRGEGHQMVVLP